MNTGVVDFSRLLNLSKQVRVQQKQYFKHKTPDTLKWALKAEKMLYEFIENIEKPGLFDGVEIMKIDKKNLMPICNLSYSAFCEEPENKNLEQSYQDFITRKERVYDTVSYLYVWIK